MRLALRVHRNRWKLGIGIGISIPFQNRLPYTRLSVASLHGSGGWWWKYLVNIRIEASGKDLCIWDHREEFLPIFRQLSLCTTVCEVKLSNQKDGVDRAVTLTCTSYMSLEVLLLFFCYRRSALCRVALHFPV